MPSPEFRLASPPWRGQPALEALWRAFDDARVELLLVGGAVRDAVLGIAPHEYDLCCPAPPERIMDILRRASIPFFQTGLEHGTITAIPNGGAGFALSAGQSAREKSAEKSGERFEITSFRADIETDGRHARVRWSTDWREDAQRRDLTINALYAERDGTIRDCTGGLEDLRAGRVRFVGCARLRVQEDYLRILRYFRFLSRYGRLAPDAETLDSLRSAQQGLRMLSVERVRDELQKILLTPDPARALDLMRRDGHLASLHESLTFSPERWERLRALEHATGTVLKGAACLRFYVLCLVGKASRLAQEWRFPKSEQKRWRFLDERPFLLSDWRAESALHGIEATRDRLALGHVDGSLSLAEASESLEELSQWTPPKFPLSGESLRALGIESGPAMGRLLRVLREEWIESGFILSAGQLRKRAHTLSAEKSVKK